MMRRTMSASPDPEAAQAIVTRKIPAAVALAAVVSVAGNAAVWSLGTALDHMTIGLVEVIAGSVVGSVLGGVALALCGRFSKRPLRTFHMLAITVVVLYAGGPVSAYLAPYREGAELFNVPTLIATEVMHLVSAAATVLILRRAARPSTHLATESP